METTELRIRAATPDDRAPLRALLTGLSADSAYLRFQTGLGPVPGRAVLDALLPTRARGRALLGYVGSELVAHGIWVRSGARAAEIGLVVADAHQQQGIGAELAVALMADLAEHGIERIEVFSGAGNDAVRRLVHRYAPHAVRVLDAGTGTYTFPVDRGVGRALAG